MIGNETNQLMIMKRERIVMAIVMALMVFMFLTVSFYFFRPVSFSIDEPVDKLTIRLMSPPDYRIRTYEINDADDINRLVSMINEASYRRAIMLSYEAPDNLLARIKLVQNNESVADIVVIGGSVNKFRFHIHSNGQTVVAYNDKEISSCISDLLLV